MAYLRYSFVIDAKGSIKGKTYQANIQSIFFSFSVDEELRQIAIMEAWELFDTVVPDWFATDIGEEEFVPVSPHEASGIGFYYLHVLLDDKVVNKVHLRRRRKGISFFSLVVSALKSLVGWS